MSFMNKVNCILEQYQDEYFRPLKYIDPRNLSKISDPNLLNEHNQTVNFCNAVHKKYEDSITWFELSVGTTKSNQRSGTNAIDGIVYIPSEETLLIIESKGLRNIEKYKAMLEDLIRTLGQNRINDVNAISNYKVGIKKPKHIYAITLADIWKQENLQYGMSNNPWDIKISKERQKIYDVFKNQNPKVQWWQSEPYSLGGSTFHLLAMICELTANETKTYTFL